MNHKETTNNKIEDSSKSIIIAIDGPAGAGKSTIAKLLAERLGFYYLDTGAMYRALTLKAIRRGVNLAKTEELIELAISTNIDFKHDLSSNKLRVLLDGEDVTEQIRSPEVNRYVSEVAKVPEVRVVMTKHQRAIGTNGRWVVDGRDIGTVVFPNAQIKIFLSASIEERAKRRYKEFEAKGYSISFEDIIKELKMRDEIDTTRSVAPLRQAEGAYYIDTSNLSIEQVLEKILTIVNNVLGSSKAEEGIWLS